MYRLLTLALACLVMAGFAQDRSVTLMEARLYVDDASDLDRLGNLAGELDVCTVQEDESGRFLVINADARQLEQVRARGLRAEVTWPDIRDKFYSETGVPPDDPDAGRDFGFFLTYWEMQDSLDSFATNFPDICRKYSLGNSHQGRPVWCLKISDNPDSSEHEPACFFNGAIHAREPMGTSCVMTFAAGILAAYGGDRNHTTSWLVDNREIYIVPVENPDGYVYNSDSGGASSSWRKSRHPYPGGIGVDLNRNYAYKWAYDDGGSSPSPSSWQYRGPHPFSEPAAAAIRDLVLENEFRTCLNYHSYGRYNLYPWGYSQSSPPEQALLQEMVDTFRMYNNYSAGHTGQIARDLYPCNGIASDWDYCDSAGKFTSYAFLCELSTSFWRGWDDSVHIREECNLNIPNLYYLARVAGTYFDPVATTVNDTATGNSSGHLDPGETAEMWFTIRNRAVHPTDSAHSITAKLVSFDTLVTVLDSPKPFPDVQRRSDVDNHADRFLVRASPHARAGDTIPLSLEVTFTDAGNTIMMPVSYEVVLGGDIVGIEATPKYEISRSSWPSIVRGSLVLPAAFTALTSDFVLVSASGRLVMDLAPGINDIRHLAPGVYFCRRTAGSASSCPASDVSRTAFGVRKVIVP